MKPAISARTVKRQRGFSLLEVLITIVVLSIGLLGFAGLQAFSLKNNRLAMQRSLATMYAYSILDSIRVNSANASDYLVPDYVSFQGTDGTIAGDDVSSWLNQVNANLPSGQGRITANGTIYKIDIQWTESVSADDSKTVTFSTASSL